MGTAAAAYSTKCPRSHEHSTLAEQGRGGGFKARFNPGSNSGAGSEGGEGEYQHQEPGVQPRLKPGSTQVKPRFNPV